MTDDSILFNQESESAEAKKVRHYFENLIAKIPGHVFWKNKNGIFLGCNDQQAQTLGFQSRHDVIGKTTYDMISSNQPEEQRRKQAQLINETDRDIMFNGHSSTVEEPLILPNGNQAIYLSRKSPLYDEHGYAIGILGVAFDITDKKRAQVLELEKKQAETAADIMQVLSASMAHEIRTPLAAITAGIASLEQCYPVLLEAYKLAKDNNLNVGNIKYRLLGQLPLVLESLSKQARVISTFVDLSLSNLNARKIQKEYFQQHAIVDVIHNTIDEYPFDFDEEDMINLVLDNHFQFLGDEKLMQHVLFNLIKNALFSIKSANKGRITITLECDRNTNKLLFEDTGKGIIAEDIPQIFDQFFTKKTNGTGTGLAFCKMVIESFNGKISCESRLGEYARFIIALPII